MTIDLIVTDVDGCLSPEESIPWELDAFSHFARLCRNASEGSGPVAPLTICTGRPQPYVEALAKILDIRAPMICENGAVLYSLHDNRARYGPGVTEEKIRGLRAVRSFLDSEILPAYPEVLMQFGKEAQLSIFSERPELFAGITPRLESFVKEEGGPQLLINTSHFYLNISLAGVDKGMSLRLVLEEMGVDVAHAAGIGDTEGDLPMREHVAFFACPANAKRAVKDVADYVSPFPDLKGVIDILGRPELQKRR